MVKKGMPLGDGKSGAHALLGLTRPISLVRQLSSADTIRCRPKSLNALDDGMCVTLHRLYDDWEASPDVHAIVIKGAGGKAFCAGGDVKGVVQLMLSGQQDKAIRCVFALSNNHVPAVLVVNTASDAA